MGRTALFLALSLTQAWTQTPVNTLSSCEKEQGFELQFDGTRESFQAQFVNWESGQDTNSSLDTNWRLSIEGTAIYAPGATQDLRSRRMYGDFDWRMDFRSSGADKVYYRMLTRGTYAWSTATEYTIDNNTNQGKQNVGSLYDIFAPDSLLYHPFNGGKWNSVRIVAKGDSVEHWMNGRKLVGFRYWNARWNEAFAASKWANDMEKAQETRGCRCIIPRGYLGFQGDWDGTWYIRNLRIQADSAKVALGPDRCADPVVLRNPPRPSAYSLRLPPRGGPLAWIYLRAGQAEAVRLDGRSLMPTRKILPP